MRREHKADDLANQAANLVPSGCPDEKAPGVTPHGQGHSGLYFENFDVCIYILTIEDLNGSEKGNKSH